VTYQEILQEITKNRASPLEHNGENEIRRKLDKIEWALQALAEKLRDDEALMEIARAMDNDHAN
jgi:hypothetical protein